MGVKKYNLFNKSTANPKKVSSAKKQQLSDQKSKVQTEQMIKKLQTDIKNNPELAKKAALIISELIKKSYTGRDKKK